MKGKEISSLVNMVSKSRSALPLLFAGAGLNRLTQANLVLPDETYKKDYWAEQKEKQRQAHNMKQKPASPPPPRKPNAERTFIMIKPDGVQRGLIGKIIERFEQKGFHLTAMKLTCPSEEHLEIHYGDLRQKPFFKSMINYMTFGPVCAMVWEGLGSVKTARKMLGETNPADSAPGSIRGDFCIETGRNICHGSDSVANAEKEIDLWFKKDELLEWKSHEADWINE